MVTVNLKLFEKLRGDKGKSFLKSYNDMILYLISQIFILLYCIYKFLDTDVPVGLSVIALIWFFEENYIYDTAYGKNNDKNINSNGRNCLITKLHIPST